MCGRYTIRASVSDLQRLLPGLSANEPLEARYNVAPTQAVPVVANDGRLEVKHFRWGLIPRWAKDEAIGARMINARSETLAEKPSFRTAYRRRRCLVLADGFYEWRKESDGSKTPVFIHMCDDAPFTFAGLWETWRAPGEDGELVKSCTIITTSPNELLADVHDRMPVILRPEERERWLDETERTPEELADLLVPHPADAMSYHAVGRAVGNPRNQGPELIRPA